MTQMLKRETAENQCGMRNHTFGFFQIMTLSTENDVVGGLLDCICFRSRLCFLLRFSVPAKKKLYFHEKLGIYCLDSLEIQVLNSYLRVETNKSLVLT
jgi:hypothetical protein